MNFSSFLRHHWRQLRQLFWRTLTLPSRALSGLSRGIGRLMRHWWTSRKFRYLVRGLPSLLAAGVCGYLAIVVSMQTTHSKALAYTTAARSAMDSGQYGTAKLYYQRVVELDAADNKALYDLARAANAKEDYSQLTVLMDRLAPIDRPVYADAHIWQATRYYALAGHSPENMDLAETHLRHALRLKPDDLSVHAMLGELYFMKGLWEPAARHLNRVALQQPLARLPLAKAYVQLGDEERARRWGENARAYYTELLAQDLRDQQARLGCAEATMFLEEYQNAERILKEGLELEGANPGFQFGLARVYASWADALNDNVDPQYSRRFDLLSAALLLNPDDPRLFDRLIAMLNRDDASAEQTREFLLDNITNGRALAMSHLLLGSSALERTQPDDARFHLEQAYRIAPSSAVVANNLAWQLIQSTPPEPQRALELINSALQQRPDDLRIVDTRGQILVRLERYDEAILDLEQALRTHNRSPQTHRALASAYTHLNQPQLAERHERLAADLSPPAESDQP